MEEKYMYCFSWQVNDYHSPYTSSTYREAFVISTDNPVEFTKVLKENKPNVLAAIGNYLTTSLKVWKFENGKLVELSGENISKAVSAAKEYIRLSNDLEFYYKKLADLNQLVSDHYKEMAKVKNKLSEAENLLPEKIGSSLG